MKYTPSNTRAGRSLISPRSISPRSISPEIAAWNAVVDARKRDKILLRTAKLAAEQNSIRNAYANRKLAV